MQKVSKIWYVVFVLTLLLLMVGGTRHWLHRSVGSAVFPLENGAAWFKRQVAARVITLFKAQQVLSRVRVLEDEVAQLRLDAAELERVAEENASLRVASSMPQRTAYRPERCLVLSRGGSSGWWRTLRVNKGRVSGVCPGDAVISPDGLVGYVTDTTETSANVRLITDPNSRIACALDVPGTPSPARGILRGCGWSARGGDVANFLYVAEPMRIDYLERGQSKPNDAASGTDNPVPTVNIPARTRVVTSGLSGTIPGGIPVGWLVGTEDDPDGHIYLTGEVLPAVDFANLTTLFVLTGPGGRGK